MFIDLTNCAALLLIPYLVKESPIVFFEENIRQPRIVCGVTAETYLPKIIESSTKFEIKIEDVIIGYTVEFVKAFGMLLSAYYVFNVAYVERVESSMQLIQRLLLEISDGVKIQAEVLSLIAKIKKLLL